MKKVGQSVSRAIGKSAKWNGGAMEPFYGWLGGRGGETSCFFKTVTKSGFSFYGPSFAPSLSLPSLLRGMRKAALCEALVVSFAPLMSVCLE